MMAWLAVVGCGPKAGAPASDAPMALGPGGDWETLGVFTDQEPDANDILFLGATVDAAGGRIAVEHSGYNPITSIVVGEEVWMDLDGRAVNRRADRGIPGADSLLVAQLVIGGDPDRRRWAMGNGGGEWRFGEEVWGEVTSERREDAAGFEPWVLRESTFSIATPESLDFTVDGRALGAAVTGGEAPGVHCAPLAWSIASGQRTRHAHEGVSIGVTDGYDVHAVLTDAPLIVVRCFGIDVENNVRAGEVITPWSLSDASMTALQGNVDVEGALGVVAGTRLLSDDTSATRAHAVPGGVELWRRRDAEIEVVRYDLAADAWTRGRRVRHPFDVAWITAGWPQRRADGSMVAVAVVDGFPAIFIESDGSWFAAMDGSERADLSADLAMSIAIGDEIFAVLHRRWPHPPRSEFDLESVGYVVDLVRYVGP